MQFVSDYPLVVVLGCCSVLLMLGLTWKVRQGKNILAYLVVSWFVLIGILIVGVYSVHHVANATKGGLRNNLSGLAKSFAFALKDAGHENVTFDTPDDDPLYEKMLNLMSTWQSHIPVAASIYTFRKNADGEIAFICCPPADLNRDGKLDGEDEELVPKGTVYEFKSRDDIPEIFDAFAGKSGFSKALSPDKWGLWITAAEPMFGKSSDEVDAVLGVDFWGEEWNAHVQRAVWWAEVFVLLSIILFFSVQIFIIRQHIIEDKLTTYAADLERVTDELVAAKKKADVAVQAKSYFLANISHEIRTPMSAILGCVSLLVKSQNKPQDVLNQEQLVDIIQKSSKNLLALIDDVLTFSSLDTNRIVLESVPIDLRQLVEDVRIMVGSHLEEKPQLQWHTVWADSLPKTIVGDPTRIRQMLLALVNNAIKFTEHGSITIRGSSVLPSEWLENSEDSLSYASATSTSSQVSSAPFLSPHIAQARGLRGMVHTAGVGQSGLQTTLKPSQVLNTWKTSPTALLLRIDVSDTGIGIAKDQLDTLFDPFLQVDNTTTRKFGGVGLGLSIVKGLVELMGGDVQVASKPGYGSTFSVFIPVSGRES